ncbi:MAG: lasso peptide biosynthesis B2 protein [Gammaproteobacteria bacterium]
MEPYFLAPHVYTCVTDDHVVLLDLRRDKYVGVSRDQMASLEQRVKGWPFHSVTTLAEGADGKAKSGRSDALLAKMVAAGMLTTDAAVGKDASPIAVPRPEAALVEDDLETQPRVTFTHAFRFLRASAMETLEMKLRSIESVMTRVRAHKARRRANTSVPLDLVTARAAVGAFIRLRPLLFGAQDACLYDSLALVRYLSYYGIFPECVIGVQTGPFVAHCWVQEGTVIFNDAPEYIRRYTPILAV